MGVRVCVVYMYAGKSEPLPARVQTLESVVHECWSRAGKSGEYSARPL